MEPAARTNNMTHAALPRSEAFHLRLEVQARARNERQRGTIGLRVRQHRHLSLSYLSERCVRVDSCYTIIHLHVFVKRLIKPDDQRARAAQLTAGGRAEHGLSFEPMASDKNIATI
ncbi:hypothetical protein EVAR_52637_1 [Eumeta japonica]|uniref:Uncharacterized protein n=1 Tax=Eumeta variegata TaxID=151549 RepID=A0A4C1XY02_EUMVA|nr:hypothetical protein EVAR_52637_1 [Eumeta japonica]